MAFLDNINALNERAESMEQLEGTKKLSFVLTVDDRREFSSSALKQSLIMMSIVFVICVIGIIAGILLREDIFYEIFAILAVFVGFVALFIFLGSRANKNLRKATEDEIELSFNFKGIVMRTSSVIDCAVYAYDWTEFDRIVEYAKLVVAIRSGLAFIFPKRIFSQEEYEIFRRFSFNAIGKKCAYKKFKQ